METKEEVNAKKTKMPTADSLRLLREASQLYIAKGKKVVHYDLTEESPDDETLAKLAIGRSGNLRAPTLRIGDTIIVGFHQETYDDLLG